MSEIDKANNSGKDCELAFNLIDRAYCKTHDQVLLYIYKIKGKLYFRCQVGEDMNPSSKLRRLVGDE